MKTLKKMIALIVLLSVYCSILSQTIPPERNFFTGRVSGGTFAVGSPVTTRKINDKINEASRVSGGGLVTIPAGNHSINSPILLKSNVHIRIHPNAVFRPTRPMRTVFSIGQDNPGVKITNVRIFCANSGRKFTIDYSRSTFKAKAIRAFHLGYVENFEISNFLVKDNLSFQAAVHMVPYTAGGNTTTSFNRRPNRGVIKNGNTTGADFGYGLVQIGSARNILLKNIEGTGGITLRIEGSFNDLAQAGRTNGRTLNIYAENVSCKNGNAAVSTQPHTKVMGKVVVNKVTSTDCATGIRLARGFSRFGIPAGFCRPSPHIGGEIIIKRTGASNAQIREPFHLYYPVNFLANNPINNFALIGGADPRARKAPAVVPIAHFSRRNASGVGPNNQGFYGLRYTPSNGRGQITGFDCTPMIVNAADIRRVCRNSSSKVLVNENADSQELNITSNNKTVTVEAASQTSIAIFNLNGNLVNETTVTSGASNIELPALSAGIYIVKATSVAGSKTQKIIIN